MFKQFFEVFWPKAKEYVAEQGLNKALNIKDFEDTLENLQNNLKLLSAKAIDVETEIKNAEDSGGKKRKREVEVWLEGVESIKVKVEELGREAESIGFMMRFLDGGKAAQLNADIDKLVQQRLHVGEPVLDTRGTRGVTLLTNEMVGEAFNLNFETILEVLKNGQVSRIGVYGMGGVGKTTLAKHIYNRVVQDYEGRVVWVTVSHEFTIKSLQEKIAHFMGVKLEDEDEEAFRASRLRKILFDRKILILILDDVWRNIDMREVGCDLEGCRLLITTRSPGVCRQIGCQKEILVGKLQEGEAWKLFNERLGNEKLDPEVEGFAKSMVKLCGGLPLAIITVARTMRGKRDSHRWRNDFLELKERVKGHDGRGEDVVFEVLKFSFDRLKEKNDKSNEFNRFQLCFLYCSLYPEDYQIDRDDLVGKFISGGLLDERRSRRAQVDQGHSILDELVDVCLLESSVDSRGYKCVKMHDLVRSMALRICKGKYLVRVGEWSFEELPNQEEWTEDLEKVSLMRCDITRIGEGFSLDCPKLSTLLLWGNIELKVIPESLLSKMQGLCTLDLSWNHGITMLPYFVSDLTSLKSLCLEGCERLEKVPYLGKMKALRELNLSGTTIKEAPQGLEELFNLRFLSMDARGLKMLPRGVLLKLVHLEHLSIPLNLEVEIEEIENLKRLEEFSGGVKSVSDFNKFVRSRGDDPCYRIRVSKKKDDESAIFKMGWPKVPNNNELHLLECDLKDEKVFGKGVVFLTISICEGVSKWLVDDLWERFDNPTSLKSLDISECGGIEWIMRSEDCQLSTTLEEIDLRDLDDLKGVVEVMEREGGGIGIVAAAQPPVFSSLKRLLIFMCKKMRKLGLPAVSSLPNIEEIEIRWCEEVEEIFEEEDEDEGRDYAITLPKLTRLELQDLPRLRKVGLPASRGVPNLKEIWIDSCGEIEEIFEKDKEDEGRDSATTLPKLRKLELINLPRLRKVGLPAASGVPNLEVIEIGGCGEIQEIFEKGKEEGRDFVPTLTKLTGLELFRLPRLRKVGLPAASRVLNLEEIRIRDCEEVEEIFEEEDEGRAVVASILPKLARLELYKLPRLKRVSKATIISNSIREIDITKCPELMKKLPLHFGDPTPPPSLKKIAVEREWWESLEWDNPLLPC